TLSTQGQHLRPRREHHRGQRGSVRRHLRPGVHQRDGRRAVLRPQLRRHRRGGGRGGPWLRVHDRRPLRDPRPHGKELRSRDVRRHRLCAGRKARPLYAPQQGPGDDGHPDGASRHRR
ncbi:Recombinase, partial [Dysosmobacter welbionis]